MKSIFNNLKYLHIVRGFAALVVVIFHAKFVLWVGGTVYNHDRGLHGILEYLLFAIDMLSSCGEQCVIIFFILSAFVIRHSYDKYKDNMLLFYKLRLYRIYLPFLFSIIFSIVIMLTAVYWINPAIITGSRQYNTRLFDSFHQLSVAQVLNTVFLVEPREYSGGNYAYWSLGHELVFYILFPFYYLLKRNAKALLAVAFLLLFIFTEWRIFYFQVFFLGGLLLYDYFAGYSEKPLIRNKWVYAVLLAILFISINLSIKIASPRMSDIVTFIFCFFLFDYVFYFVRASHSIWSKLGDISYTLYLNHLPLLMVFYAYITLYAGKLVFYSRLPYYGGVLFALLCSIPLYHLVEKPSITILKKIRR